MSVAIIYFVYIRIDRFHTAPLQYSVCLIRTWLEWASLPKPLIQGVPAKRLCATKDFNNFLVKPTLSGTSPLNVHVQFPCASHSFRGLPP